MMNVFLVRGKMDKVICFLVCLSLLASSCKKDKKPQVQTATREELTKDSIYLYAKETYYWNTSLPDYATFNPRRFANKEAEVFALTQYSLNPATGKPYEYDPQYPNEAKYSFIDDGSVSSQLGGVAGDFGFSVFYNANANPSTDLRIKYVYGNSPASAAGLKRGYQIVQLNGRSNLTSSDADINYVVNAIFGNGSTVNLTVKKPDGTQQDVIVTRATYSLNPILYTHVYTTGSKKVGYLVFNSFTTNSGPNLEQAFNDFTAQGITEVIVDLRYNGGGSVETASTLINLIAPASQNGKVMYTTYFNKTMQDGKATILKNQPFYYQNKLYSYYDIDYKPTVTAGNVELFAKKGSANISRAYFIVSGSTASASELTINSLKPVIDVKVIGKKTYGKPVGFFPLRIEKYDLYIPQFETKNQLDAGGYYGGILVDKDDIDDVTKDFGDPTERLLAYALNYSVTGAYAIANPKTNISASSAKAAFTSSEIEHITNQLDKNEFKGMIDKRFTPKN